MYKSYQACFVLFLFITLTAEAQHYSLNFDGTDDAVSLGDVLNFEVGDPFTIQAWVKPDPFHAYQQIISKCGADYRGWGLQLSFGKPEIYFVDKLGQDQIIATADITIDDSQWHSITVNHLGNGQVMFQVDTAFQTMTLNSLGTPDTIATTSNVIIGSLDVNDSSGEFFSGNIDELRIWDTTLGPNTIYTIHHELTGNEPHLIGYYKFDDTNSTCDVVDYSPSGNHGIRLGSQGVNTFPRFSPDTPALIFQSAPFVSGCGSIDLAEKHLTTPKLYPNPSNGLINIELGDFENADITIVNLHGVRVLKEEVLGPRHSLQTNLAAGHYVISLRLKRDTYTYQLIIE